VTTLDDYAAIRSPLPDTPESRLAEVVVGEKDGSVKKVVLPLEVQADDRALLRGASLDPDAWVITPGTRRHKRWQRYDGEWLNWWSFDFQERTLETPEERAADLEALKRMFKKAAPKPPKIAVGDDAFVFVVADWQVGKNSEHTINLIRAAIQQAKIRIKFMRALGYAMPTLFIPCLGDLGENCDGHYAQQTFIVDLDRRGQNKVVRRLLREIIAELAPLFTEVIVAGVGGNHGENRKDGKSFTTFADNDDVAVLEILQELFEVQPGFEHVRFIIPNDELAICVEVAGVNVGMTHGHLLSRGGKLAANKAQEWWTGQIWGLQACASAKILLSGHYHHVSAVTFGPRTHIQSPAVDGGSKWWTDLTGQDSPDGILCFRLSGDLPLGWDNLQVL
jgi:hypothetical protein